MITLALTLANGFINRFGILSVHLRAFVVSINLTFFLCCFNGSILATFLFFDFFLTVRTNHVPYAIIHTITTISPEITCPVCGTNKNQTKKGYTGAGSARCFCKDSGKKYTANPKTSEYPDEAKRLL